MDLEKLECLYLKWQDYKTGQKYFLGTLYRDKEHGKYYFKLSAEGVEKAKEAGFSTAALIFDDVNRVYESDVLFSVFRTRAPRVEKINPEILWEILNEFNMKEYDEFEYLKITHGRMITDHFLVEEEK